MAEQSSCSHACEAAALCMADCAEQLEDDSQGPHIYEIFAVIGLLMCSGLFSGLTLGMMSLDVSNLELVIAGGEPQQKRQAERILPIRRRGNLLLCTLLLGNVLVNSLLAILTASFTGGIMGLLISTACILIFGEIIPQSVCSRYSLAAGSKSVDIVRLVIIIIGLIAWPISKILDHLLGNELGTIYTRTELKELFTMQIAERAEAGKSEGLAQEDAASKDRARVDVRDSMRNSAGGIKSTEAAFLCGALSLSERIAEQIMTPMSDVFCIHTEECLDFKLMRRIADSGHTRASPPCQRSPV